MPREREALTEADTNGCSTRSEAAKTSSPPSPLEAPSRISKPRKYKFSNESTLAAKPQYLNLQWPNFAEFVNDKDQDVPKVGEAIDEWCYKVSDLGIPMSLAGTEMCAYIEKEEQKRNQDVKGVHLYTDWNGWAMSEVMANMLKNFNRDVFKKSISPYQKWAYVEGFAMYVMAEDLAEWMGNEDGETVVETVQMLGLMVLTCFEVLAEHSLLVPDSEVKNIGIISLLLLEFLDVWATDLDCEWGSEVVRLCDEAGIELEKFVRKQVAVKKEKIGEHRELYRKKKEDYDKTGELEKYGGNGYEVFADKSDWTPADDVGTYSKMWYRWDWALEYKEFKVNHAGGSHHVLTRTSRR